MFLCDHLKYLQQLLKQQEKYFRDGFSVYKWKDIQEIDLKLLKKCFVFIND